ncbi:MAG: nucleotidyltransferase family protein [Campylobacterales bacterium]
MDRQLRERFVLDYLGRQKSRLADRYGVSQIILFGSTARGEAREDSDVDIAVQTDLADYFKLFDLKEELEQGLGAPVDLIRLRTRMNPALKARIEREGVRV